LAADSGRATGAAPVEVCTVEVCTVEIRTADGDVGEWLPEEALPAGSETVVTRIRDGDSLVVPVATAPDETRSSAAPMMRTGKRMDGSRGAATVDADAHPNAGPRKAAGQARACVGRQRAT